MLSIIDRYLLWKVMGAMLATIAIGLVILSAARMLLFVQTGANFAQEFATVAILTALFIPHYLGFMLPLSLYWGTYHVARQLSLNSELTSLFGVGMSSLRFNAPLLGLALVVTLINAGITGWLEPLARYAYREVRYQIENLSPYLAVGEGVFSQVGAQTILVDHIDRQSKTFNKIFVYEPHDFGGSTEITAARGVLQADGGKISLLLQRGTRLHILRGKDNPNSNGRPEMLDFQELSYPLTQTVAEFRGPGEDEQELSLLQLLKNTDTPPEGTHVSEMKSELHRKLVIILSSLFLPLLATSLARTNLRGRNVIQGIVCFGFLIFYQQIVQFGGLLTEETGLSPAITLWPAFAILAFVSLTMLFLQDHRSGQPSDWVIRSWAGAKGLLRPRKPKARPQRPNPPRRTAPPLASRAPLAPRKKGL